MYHYPMKGSAKWKDSRALHRRSLCLCGESLVAKAQRKDAEAAKVAQRKPKPRH